MADHLDKIKKLLRLSKSSNQAEAELALSRAQEIAVKHGIDIALAEDAPEKEDIGRTDVQEKVYRRSYKVKSIDGLLHTCFPIRISWSGTRTTIIGRKSDVEFILWLRPYLQETYTRLAAQEAKTNSYLDRTAFYKGLTSVLCGRLLRAKQAAEAEEFARRGEPSREKYALVVVDQKAALEVFQRSQFAKVRSTDIDKGRAFDETSYYSGVRAGSNVNTNRPLADATVAARLS